MECSGFLTDDECRELMILTGTSMYILLSPALSLVSDSGTQHSEHFKLPMRHQRNNPTCASCVEDKYKCQRLCLSQADQKAQHVSIAT